MISADPSIFAHKNKKFWGVLKIISPQTLSESKRFVNPQGSYQSLWKRIVSYQKYFLAQKLSRFQLLTLLKNTIFYFEIECTVRSLKNWSRPGNSWKSKNSDWNRPLNFYTKTFSAEFYVSNEIWRFWSVLALPVFILRLHASFLRLLTVFVVVWVIL